MVRLVCAPGTADAGDKAWQARSDFAYRGGGWEAVNFERGRYLEAVWKEFDLEAVPSMGD